MSPAVGATVGEAIRDATHRIGVDWARLDAELLMAHALGCSRSDMLLRHMRDPAPGGFAGLLERRIADEPVAYIIGEAEFFGRRFTVNPDVLIPRIDSETVVNAALAAAPDPRRVLDCGVGSGCLLLTVLAERSGAMGIGIDRAPQALAVASRNAEGLGIATRAELRQADWTMSGWAADLGRFDLVIANPPYVESEATLDASVRDHEPHGALFAGPDGLDDYRILIPQLRGLLAPGGAAVLEIGWRQAGAVTKLAKETGFDALLTRDLADRPRALTLTYGDSYL